MEEKNNKYDELLEKAQLIKNVGQKINELISSNNWSIEYYQKQMTEALEANADADVTWQKSQIETLEKENKLIAEVEAHFWKTHVF